ncbi:MAG: DUF4129 domain-containing protein [Gemmatimonadota bacterium]|nr:DUF4129 domain-containing protein [Gemmatimonadota bacterium]
MNQLPEPGEVARTLREILAGPEFVTFGEPGRWQFLTWIWQKLVEIWIWLQRLTGDGIEGVAEILVIVVPLVVLVVAALVVSRHGRGLLPGHQGDDPGLTAEGPPRKAGEWLSMASERAIRGELRPAATALYQGFLLTLEQQGTLSFHNSKTPGDYALELARGRAAAREPTSPGSRFLTAFQDFSFGRDRPSVSEYAGLESLAREAGCPVSQPEGESRYDE